MKQFTKTPSCWDGVSLNRNAVKYFRDAVYGGRASLIDLRNYIFIRQWQMLINTHKGWDAAHRLLEFLFTVVNEMKILQVKSCAISSLSQQDLKAKGFCMYVLPLSSYS